MAPATLDVVATAMVKMAVVTMATITLAITTVALRDHLVAIKDQFVAMQGILVAHKDQLVVVITLSPRIDGEEKTGLTRSKIGFANLKLLSSNTRND